jgi:hypothetical protein
MCKAVKKKQHEKVFMVLPNVPQAGRGSRT